MICSSKSSTKDVLVLIIRHRDSKWVNVRIEDENDRDNTTSGHSLAPEANNDVASHNFEGHKGSLEDKEIPSGCEAEGIINEASSEANER